MALSVIGSGFGRTGTRSLKAAFETLGCGRCHHMEEVFADPRQPPLWHAAIFDGVFDHEAIFDGFDAQIDWPGAHMWRELADAYPDAKVIHSTRPEESWWKSFSVTIGKALQLPPMTAAPPHMQMMGTVIDEMLGERTFGGRPGDRDTALAAFRRREIEVRATIPADRLLVYDVAEGWEPLCAFLGVPVPSTPFPRTNAREEFWAHLGGEPA